MKSEGSNDSSIMFQIELDTGGQKTKHRVEKDFELLSTLQKIQAESKNENNLDGDKKYPGVTFLQSGIKGGDVLVNLYSITEKQQRKIEEQKQLRNYLRNKRRHTRRLKEKIFRHNLKRAFNLKNAKIIQFEDLKKKVDVNVLEKNGRFSTFPVNFNLWKSNNNKRKRKAKINQAVIDKKIEFRKEELLQTLKKSKDVNMEGVDCVSKLLFSLKRIKKSNILKIDNLSNDSF